MINPSTLESRFQSYITDLNSWVPDGVLDVDLHLLHSLDLLTNWNEEEEESALTHFFHVIETSEKLTLFNEQFVAWIVPYTLDQEAVTLTLLASLNEESLHLELAFMTSGVYNNSQTVLKVLERFIQEVQETESVLADIKGHSQS